jgi:serine protease Do
MTFIIKITITLCAVVALLNVKILAQETIFEKEKLTAQDMSNHIQSLSGTVAKSVVQIFVTSYEPVQKAGELQIAKVRGSGSGVIVDQNGYIVTNLHVVRGAVKIKIILQKEPNKNLDLSSILKPVGDMVEGKIIGVDQETDLAIIKIEGTNFPYLQFGDSDELNPGQLVFAYGSPLGLTNSVTMGVVSSVARQLTPESPMIYIQTDASINPGNSGGPLVNMRGDVVGISTLIFSQSGGSEGIGFAAPSNIVKRIYEQIRLHGRVKRGTIGVNAQTITPYLAEGLGITQTWGVIVSDVYPGGTAYKAGLKPGDIILTLDGKIMENGRQLRVNLYGRSEGDKVRLEVLRGIERLTLHVEVMDIKERSQSFVNMVDLENHLIPKLGILGLELNDELLSLLPLVRTKNGVLVAALVGKVNSWEGDLRTGDIIISVNNIPMYDFESLKKYTDDMDAGHICVVHVERAGQFKYVTLEVD